MEYFKITKEQAMEIPRYYGITSGKKDKETGVRPTIYFCSNDIYVKFFGESSTKEFVEI